MTLLVIFLRVPKEKPPRGLYVASWMIINRKKRIVIPALLSSRDSLER
jgi:hypothetical protein